MTQCGDLYRTSILFVPSFRSPLLCPLNSLGVMGRKGDVSDQRQFSCIILSEDSLTTNHSSNNREYAFSPMICHTFVFLITSGQALSKFYFQRLFRSFVDALNVIFAVHGHVAPSDIGNTSHRYAFAHFLPTSNRKSLAQFKKIHQLLPFPGTERTNHMG